MSEQLTRAELQSMSSEEIVKAQNDGRLDVLLAGRDPEPAGAEPGEEVDEPEDEMPGSADQGARGGGPPGQLTRSDLWRMSSAEIVKAQEDGRLDQLLRRP